MATNDSAALAAWVQARLFIEEKGNNPSIACNNHDTAIACYAEKDPDNSAYYYYYCIVGKIGASSIAWGDKIEVAHASATDSEWISRVALNDDHLFIVVWDSNYKMYARGGRIDPVTLAVSFGNVNEWDSGQRPAIALNNSNIAVEVHQGDGNPERIYYSVGSIDPSTKWVSFNDSKHYDGGHRPNVAINNANYVLEAHETDAFTDSLWCTVGKIQEDLEHIEFGDPHDYDNGLRPSVALNDSNETMEVHWASEFSTEVWSHAGTIDTTDKTPAWNAAWNYDQGGWASCAMNNARDAVEAHMTTQLGDTLGSRVGKYFPG